MIVQFCKYVFLVRKKNERKKKFVCVYTGTYSTHSCYCSILVSIWAMELIIICILGNKNGTDQFIGFLEGEAISKAYVYGSTWPITCEVQLT